MSFIMEIFLCHMFVFRMIEKLELLHITGNEIISVEDIKKLISEAVDRAIGGAEDGYAGLLDAIHDNLNGFRDEISNQIGKYATTTTIQTMIDRSINGLNLGMRVGDVI